MKRQVLVEKPAAFTVGIGASAGGLDPVKELVKKIKQLDFQDTAFILVIHQNDRFESHLLEILAPECELPMKWVEDGELLLEGHFYLCPAQHDVWVQEKRIKFLPGQKSIPGPSIDRMLTGLALTYGASSVAIILSGTGHDGALGSHAVEQAGGRVFTQTLESAQYPQMPEACLRKCPEAVAMPIPELILEIRKIKHPQPLLNVQESGLHSFKKLVSYKLKYDWKLDLNWFQPSWREPILEDAVSQIAQINRQDQHQSEAIISELANNAVIQILRHQDHFFFNQPIQPHLYKWVNQYFNQAAAKRPLRIWVPFAGTGEFAYSISMCIQSFLENHPIDRQIQIFTSDLVESSIESARRGLFPEAQVKDEIPKEYHRYFQPTRNTDILELVNEVKSRIIFSPHNPFSDPPFLHLDLIVCGRFFNRLAQEARLKVRDLFAYSLKPEGCLITEDPHWLDFSPGPFFQDNHFHQLFLLDKTTIQYSTLFKRNLSKQETSLSDLVQQMVKYEHTVTPTTTPESKIHEKYYVVVDKQFEIKFLSEGLGPVLLIPNGPLNQNLFRYLNEKLETEVRAQLYLLTEKKSGEKPSFRKITLFDGKNYFVKVRVDYQPLQDIEDGYLIAFDLIQEEELTQINEPLNWQEKLQAHEYEREINALKLKLESAESAISASEQIQSALNQELTLLNNRLQQSNEQLEGSKEELESSNEELKVAYQELKSLYNELEIKEQKLEVAYQQLQELISNSFEPYLLISQNYEVVRFNSKAADVFEECANIKLEAGKSLLSQLEIGNLNTFLKHFHKAISGNQERGEFRITDLKGRRRHFYFSITPLFNESNQPEHVLYNFLDFSDLNEIKEELEERNLLIESVFKAVDVSLIVIDAQGIILTCNEATSKLLEAEWSTLIGKNYSSIIKMNHLENLHISTNPSEKQQHLFELMLSNGTYKLVQATTRRFSIHEGESMQVLSLVDITDKIRYLNLLEDTQAAAHVGGWEYDIRLSKFETTDEVRRIVPEMQLETMNMEQAVAWLVPESKARFEQQLPALFSGLIIIEEDLQLQVNNFQTIWLHVVAKPFIVNGHVRKIIGTVQNITEKKLSELELKKLSLVASKTHNAVIITNNNQEIEWVNNGFEKLTGYSFDEVIGKNPKILQGEGTDKETIKRIGEKLTNKEPLTETILNYHKNGTPYWIELTITPVLDQNGQVEKFISIESDVTHEKKIEQQQKDLLRELTHQNQELLRFSYITSHNLRAPLANILGLLDLLEVEKWKGSEDQYVLESLKESATTLNSTLHDLVESLHHKTEGEKAKSIIDLQEAWQHTLKLFQNQLNDANAEIQTDFSSCNSVFWNKNYLNSLLQNLISNSIKYRKTGINLQLQAKIIIEDNEPVLLFRDNGQGIDVDRYKDRLFGLYQRFNTQVEGKGLGLFIVNSQVKSLGGHIEVVSQPGEGALFKVYLGKNALVNYASTEQ